MDCFSIFRGQSHDHSPNLRQVHMHDSDICSCHCILIIHINFLNFLMVICTSCQKQFKKPHGLSQHRNKCSALRSGQDLKQKKKLSSQHYILKFKKHPGRKKISTVHSRRSQWTRWTWSGESLSKSQDKNLSIDAI